MLWLPGLRPGPHWGSLQRSPDPLAEISNILFGTITEMLQEKAILNLQHQISDCIKEFFMLVTPLCTVCFSKVKISKKTLALLL